MSGRVMPGTITGEGRAAVEGKPATDEFELVSALYTLLLQASENSDLAKGGLKGAAIGEPRLLQGMNYQSEVLSVKIGGRRFRVTVKVEPGWPARVPGA